jgi:hypothetical protein
MTSGFARRSSAVRVPFDPRGAAAAAKAAADAPKASVTATERFAFFLIANPFIFSPLKRKRGWKFDVDSGREIVPEIERAPAPLARHAHTVTAVGTCVFVH